MPGDLCCASQVRMQGVEEVRCVLLQGYPGRPLWPKMSAAQGGGQEKPCDTQYFANTEGQGVCALQENSCCRGCERLGEVLALCDGR